MTSKSFMQSRNWYIHRIKKMKKQILKVSTMNQTYKMRKTIAHNAHLLGSYADKARPSKIRSVFWKYGVGTSKTDYSCWVSIYFLLKVVSPRKAAYMYQQITNDKSITPITIVMKISRPFKSVAVHMDFKTHKSHLITATEFNTAADHCIAQLQQL